MRSLVAVVALVACLHAFAWAVWQSQASAPNIEGVLNSISYSPFQGSAHPDDGGNRPTEAQIRTDLKTIAPYTNTIRLYSSTGGVEMVPPIAAEFGLKVTVGIWLDKNEKRNEREIRSAIDLVRKNRNINGVVVGNETIYRGELKVPDLIKTIQQVKREIGGAVPVTTGEIWHVFIEYPELASAVDFVAAHVLPYWEGIPAAGAVDQAVRVYSDLRSAFPGKRIVIAEFGWPSAGYNRQTAMPGKLEQASVIRSFLSRAQALGMDYNIIEAFDQPWKTFEGSVGAYWGLFDNARQPKFAWTGPIVDGTRWKISTVAVAVGVLVSLPILSMAGATLMQAALLAMTAHGIGAWTATVFEYWNGHYFVLGSAFALALGMLLLVPLVVITLRRIDEIAVVWFGRAPQRLLAPGGAGTAATGYAPKVSIHIPAYKEPPEMLKATLDAVARLDYPNFECIIVINNTPSPAMWEPVEEHCRVLGERFRFVNAPRLDGYKAGALRLALAQTAADAEIIGIINSDYAVSPDWLSDLVPAFADPKVGLVQAPQDHRDGERSPLHHVMNGEYAGFFDVGMVQRNEVNAIVVHGTMCLIRRAAMDGAGGWSSDTICEDTDLGLTILEQGWVAHYTNRRYGRGLLPDTFEAYKKQRDRWASGGFQIVRKHWRAFLPGASLLTPDQKREFAFGWINWLGAESVGVLVAIFNLVWVPVVAFAGIAVPDKVLTLPDHRDLRDLGHPLHRALQAAGADPARARNRRDDRRHGDAMDGGTRGRELHHQGPPDLRAHRQGRQGKGAAARRLPRLQRGDPRRPAAARRAHRVPDQLRAGAGDQPVWLRAPGAEPAVPRRRRARRVRELARERLRAVGLARGEARRHPAERAACRAAIASPTRRQRLRSGWRRRPDKRTGFGCVVPRTTCHARLDRAIQ